MTKQKELASLIQKGLKMENVIESKNCFFDYVLGRFHACALGFGLIGRFGSVQKAFDAFEAEKGDRIEFEKKDWSLGPYYLDIVSSLLEIDYDLADAIDKKHILGDSVITIIQKLEQEGFSY
jgi:hypothetical protein